MKQNLFASAFLFLLITFSGCQEKLGNNISESLQSKSMSPRHYQVAINRTTTIETKNESGENTPQTMTEALTANLSLRRVNSIQDRVVFKAVCDSVHMLRYDFVGAPSGVEALRQLDGKEFSLAISPQGDIVDDSSIKNLMKFAAKDPVNKSCKGTFKEPDMLTDFYNVVADLCVTTAKEMYSKGETLSRLEPTPTPAVEFTLPQRQITSTVDQLTNQEGIRKAKITEVHTLAGEGQRK